MECNNVVTFASELFTVFTMYGSCSECKVWENVTHSPHSNFPALIVDQTLKTAVCSLCCK